MSVDVQVLSFNALFRGEARTRLAAVSSVLERSSFDLVCLQEVLWRGNLDLLRRLETTLPYLASACLGPMVKGGLVTLSRWPILEQSYASYGLMRDRPRPSLGAWMMRKGLLLTRLSIAGQPFAVVNTHLQPNPSGDWSPASRYARRQRAELEALAAAVATVDPNIPVLVAGDLNVPTHAWLLDEFLAATGLQDAMEARPEPTFRASGSVPNPQPIDHVMVRPARGFGVKVDARLALRHETVRLADGRTVGLSDHYAIEAHIHLNAS